MYNELKPAPPDAILGLTEAFRADPNPLKINLGVGVYRNPKGETPIMHAVKLAERVLVDEEWSKSYLPITGAPTYGRHIQDMLFGDGHPAGERAASCHTPGGTGALRVAADFLHQVAGPQRIWASTPTWANHKGVFTAAGHSIVEYPYYDATTRGLDFDGMCASLAEAEAGDVVLLHVCCHNPTGVDLQGDQWHTVADMAKAQGWMPFFDFAYQGFAEGIEADRAALQPFLEAGGEFFVANSFSKNFGLYNERVGGLTVVAETPAAAIAAASHVKRAIRTNYSNPACHGGAIVNTILDSDELTEIWQEELGHMRDRIKAMRQALADGLTQRGASVDFSFIPKQRGMFSYSGLSDDQVNTLREAHSIYIVGGGRMNVAGINDDNIDRLCDAITAVL